MVERDTRRIVNVEPAYKMGLSGRGVTIAVVDTGIHPSRDFEGRIVVFKDFVNNVVNPHDDNCHGTHVAGIAAGSGVSSGGKYGGIAPLANIAAIKSLDVDGGGESCSVLSGLQWVLENHRSYNIRIANLSVGTNEAMSKDLLVRAVESLWDAGIVMVVAAGNNGDAPGSITSPGISKKVITVGASDDFIPIDMGSAGIMKDYSGRGPTYDCIIKPNILAPGTGIVSCLSKDLSPQRMAHISSLIIDEHHVCLSGTSMSTPVVSGAVALLLEARPDLTPDEVKLVLKHSARDIKKPPNQQGWGLLDIGKMLGGI